MLKTGFMPIFIILTVIYCINYNSYHERSANLNHSESFLTLFNAALHKDCAQ